MGTPLQSESKIPLHIYESAAHEDIGIPLKKLQSRSAQILCCLGAIISLLVVAWLGYTFYAALSYGLLAQTYPTSAAVPVDQQQNYLWLQGLHDNFWSNMPAIAGALAAGLILFGRFYLAARTQLYLCNAGLLMIYKKNVTAIRWDEVKEFYLSNRSSVTQLVREDKTMVLLPFNILGASNKAGDQAILAELMPRLLTAALASYERGDVVSFRKLQVSQQGISIPGEQVSWDNLGAIALDRGELSAYYAKAEPNGSIPKPYIRQWHIWQERQNNSNYLPVSWPNLPVFVELVNQILDRLDKREEQSDLNSLKEAALSTRVRDKRRRTIISIGIFVIISAPTAYQIIMYIYHYVLHIGTP